VPFARDRGRGSSPSVGSPRLAALAGSRTRHVGCPRASGLEENARALVVPDSGDLWHLFEPFEGQVSNPLSVGPLRGGNWLPPTSNICRFRAFAAGPALEPLISNFCRSRAPVTPVYAERASRPLVGKSHPSRVGVFQASCSSHSRVVLTW
jgi:hypothetical protein